MLCATIVTALLEMLTGMLVHEQHGNDQPLYDWIQNLLYKVKHIPHTIINLGIYN